jgi:hypothetical protein
VEDINEDFLEHHGILGMHWGHRKVESGHADGFLSSLNKKRLKSAINAQTKDVISLRKGGMHAEADAVEANINKYKKKLQKADNHEHAVGWAHSWLKEAGKMQVSSLRHPIITSKANRASKKEGTLGSKLRRGLVYQNTTDLRDVNRRIDELLNNKKK